MSAIYGWWQRDGKPICKATWDSIQIKTNWWNTKNYSQFFKNNIALGFVSFEYNNGTSSIPKCEVITINNCTITADARIDNRKDIIALLNVPNNSISDTGLILQLYLKFGEDCLNYILGAFAFMIWDDSKKLLFGARDHIGIRPFNYYYNKNTFVFGSQPKSILAVDGVDKKADWKLIVLKMSRKMSVHNNTEYLQIKKLLPAHKIKVTKNDIKINRYWTLDIEKTTVYKNDQDYVDHFMELFQESIRARMRGGKTISAHLSGGLDSSGIASIAAQIASKESKEFHAFSYTFPEKEGKAIVPKNLFNFNPLVHKQVEYSKITNAHFINKSRFPGFRNHIELETKICDGISWSNNVRTEYEIQYAMQEKGVSINLSGFLGDEIITSFCRAYYLEYLDKGKYLKFFTSKHNNKYQPLELLMLFALKLGSKIKLPVKSSSLARFYQNRKDKINNSNLLIGDDHFFNKDFVNTNETLRSALIYESESEIHHSIPLSLKEYQRNHISRLWTSRRIESEILCAMNFDVEYRYPMADIRLLQYVLSLPVEQKMNENHARLLYRRAMNGHLIEEIRMGKKPTTALKPLSLFMRIVNPQISEYWKSLKQSDPLTFMNHQKTERHIKNFTEINKLYFYFILAELIKKDKLTY